MRAGLVYLIIAFGLLAASFLKEKQRTQEDIRATVKILYPILPVLIFVFVLMGVIQAYVSRETIAAILEKETGKGEQPNLEVKNEESVLDGPFFSDPLCPFSGGGGERNGRERKRYRG